MCGISAIFSNDEKFLSVAESKKNNIIKTIERRGPDKISVIKKSGFLATHTHLRITGHAEQPVVNEKFLLLYNGEIYNDYKNYNSSYSDTHFLTSHLVKNGIDAFQSLDGEFAICLKNLETNMLYLATDPFGTKPLYYQIGDGYCNVGSYESTVSACGKTDPIYQVPANTLIEIDLKNFRITSKKLIRSFDFSHQTVNTFEKWNSAFTEAIVKRTTNIEHKCFISFSSGHDSGLIAAEMLKEKIPFHVYTVPYKEDEKILNKRLEILKRNNISYDVIEPSVSELESMHKFLLEQCEPFQLINTEKSFQNFSDPDMRNIPGYIVSAIIHKKARDDGRLISLSGQGADEIFSDYFNEFSNPSMSDLKGNWNNISEPWTNFFSGWNRVFLGGGERIAGLFGIETRYPFLDFKVVQEFLNLDPMLKSKFYKSPITNRLKELDFPHHYKKFGFAGSPMLN